MQVLKVAAWVLLAVLLVLLCVLLVRAYLRRESDAGGPAGSALGSVGSGAFRQGNTRRGRNSHSSGCGLAKPPAAGGP